MEHWGAKHLRLVVLVLLAFPGVPLMAADSAVVLMYHRFGEVESYVPGGDRIKFSGTSMASPQVVNLAAKLWAVNPKLTVQQVKDIIIGTATKSDEGILLINPAGAVQKAANM